MMPLMAGTEPAPSVDAMNFSLADVLCQVHWMVNIIVQGFNLFVQKQVVVRNIQGSL